MRIRQVKPEFWHDAKLRGLPLEHKAVYIGLWQEADDAGWLRWDVEQIALDLLIDVQPDVAEALISEAGLALSSRQRLRIYKCLHAWIPHLAEHQRLAGPTKRVYTYRNEHMACKVKNARRSSTTPRVPAVPRPVRLGQVRLGQVNHALARTNGAEQPTDPLAVAVAAIALHDSGEAPLTATAEAAMRRTIKRHEPQP